MSRRLLLLLPLLLWLAGCSTLPPPAPVPLPALDGPLLDNWSLQGKLGIRQGQRADSATLNWQQQQQHYEIRLSGPLGQGALAISGEPGQVQMAISGAAEPIVAATPEALMQSQLGWSLPLSQAHYWVQGRPAPQLASTPLPGGNGFRQLGWEVQILRVGAIDLASGDRVNLPSRLRLQYGDLRITLLIAQWLIETE